MLIYRNRPTDRPSVCPSVRQTLILNLNGWTSKFFHRLVVPLTPTVAIWVQL